MKRLIAVVIAVLVCFGVGYTARYIQASSILTWYPFLVKPGLTPPNIVFPIAWSIIYLLMGISVGLLWNKPAEIRNPAVWAFVVQLLLNFLWSVSFFYFRSPVLGGINILLLDVVVVYYVAEVYRINRLSAWLFLPYLLWLLFATYLNGYIWIYN